MLYTCVCMCAMSCKTQACSIFHAAAMRTCHTKLRSGVRLPPAAYWAYPVHLKDQKKTFTCLSLSLWFAKSCG